MARHSLRDGWRTGFSTITTPVYVVLLHPLSDKCATYFLKSLDDKENIEMISLRLRQGYRMLSTIMLKDLPPAMQTRFRERTNEI